MPRTLKRRSDLISRDTQPSPTHSSSEDAPPTTQRHRPSPAPSEDEANPSENDTQRTNTLQTSAKKLIRHALSQSYARTPIRRTDLQKLLKDGGGGTRHPFKQVFNAAQETLREVFGMELVDLPVREKGGLNERRKAAGQRATQAQSQNQREGATHTHTQGREDSQRRIAGGDVASAQAWVLISTLPASYRKVPGLLGPSRAPSANADATYTALCTFIISLIYLHPADGLPDSKLERFLRRVGIESWVPLGDGMTLEKVLQRMVRDGYVERIRDVSSGEENVEWVVGGRGRREVGERGVAGLVREVYGLGIGRGQDGGEDDEGEGEGEGQRRPVGMESEELERRLVRSLGEGVKMSVPVEVQVQSEGAANGGDPGPRRSRRQRADAEDDGEEE